MGDPFNMESIRDGVVNSLLSYTVHVHRYIPAAGHNRLTNRNTFGLRNIKCILERAWLKEGVSAAAVACWVPASYNETVHTHTRRDLLV